MSKRIKDSCWYGGNEIYEKMIQGAQGVLFPKLENSDHFPVLRNLLELCQGSSSIIDVGCGAASLGDLVSIEYTGCDLPSIIENVSQKLHPSFKFIKFDVMEDKVDFLSEYDIVVMNAFIDVMEEPLIVLNKVLEKSKKYVIIHRQKISETTKSSETSSYTGFSFSSSLSKSDISRSLDRFSFEVEKMIFWTPEFCSFLVKKK